MRTYGHGLDSHRKLCGWSGCIEMNGCGFINGFIIINLMILQTCELVSHSEKLWICKWM